MKSNSIMTSIVILALSCLPLASSLLFSPTLLRVNPFGVVAATSARPSFAASSSSEQLGSAPSASTVDYSRDDDVLRYKYELLQTVYEKSLERGFEVL